MTDFPTFTAVFEPAAEADPARAVTVAAAVLWVVGGLSASVARFVEVVDECSDFCETIDVWSDEAHVFLRAEAPLPTGSRDAVVRYSVASYVTLFTTAPVMLHTWWFSTSVMGHDLISHT
jgi:hypothetical protein